MHSSWRIKGKYVKGSSFAQRLSGQATTAIGNAIVNLIVHTYFYRLN